ncbi:putative transcription factor C2C2-YABBY family [Lupinus albus]|uniref:Putative transcription factor C2C2-YABBY family n=1 Tax=Lupinus albus TaxID=3870 RepID=A0A6A4P767_LUPAL|nr:putative transcription factor C2C2-YABBY family [Lupinus albus]
MSSSSTTLSLDHLSPSEQLCYVHCNICDTVLAVSVPCTSLFKTVTVRCGHCTNLLPVNMRGLLLPSPNQFHLGHSYFSPSHNLLEEMSNPTPNFFMNQNTNIANDFSMPARTTVDELPRPLSLIDLLRRDRESPLLTTASSSKDEIQRIKAINPDITHREAFSAAAKNWAHFPHIHFGLMPTDQTVKKTNVHQQQEGEEVLIKEGFYASPNVGFSPY